MLGFLIKDENDDIPEIIKNIFIDEVNKNDYIKVNGNMDDYLNKIKEKGRILALINFNNFSNISSTIEIIGICIYYCNDFINLKSYISQIFVVNKYQNMGYSKIIFNYVINNIKSLNFKILGLSVNNNNHKAINLYKKYKFKIINHNKESNSNSEMELNLNEFNDNKKYNIIEINYKNKSYILI